MDGVGGEPLAERLGEGFTVIEEGLSARMLLLLCGRASMRFRDARSSSGAGRWAWAESHEWRGASLRLVDTVEPGSVLRRSGEVGRRLDERIDDLSAAGVAVAGWK